MRVRILAFAQLRELFGAQHFDLALAEGSTVGDAIEQLASRAQFEPFAGSTRCARNGSIAQESEPLSDGDELALLPPVGGG